jgi:hypothetical protein
MKGRDPRDAGRDDGSSAVDAESAAAATAISAVAVDAGRTAPRDGAGADDAAPPADALGERVRGRRSLQPPTLAAQSSQPAVWSAADAESSDSSTDPTTRHAAEPAPPSDDFALEARLSEAMRVLRTTEPRIGRLLRVVVDQRIYKFFAYPTVDDYVRDRLGIGTRKAWELLKIEKATLRSSDFDRAYREGRLSWVRAAALLPVLDRTTAAAWIARAQSVTVRRLRDEVEWVLASRDAGGPNVPLDPPPVDSPLSPPVLDAPPAAAPECRISSPHSPLQICEREHAVRASAVTPGNHALEICDAEIRFTGPGSVVALLRDVLDAYAVPAEPRWTALERLLRHVINHWESTPRHPDPIFARDGWRCTVPACSSRRNLHDHHIRFRSRGGDNRRDNRTAVCAAHHLHGIHDGTIRASGEAPHAIQWQLGVRPNAPPFLTFVGDRRYPEDRPM